MEKQAVLQLVLIAISFLIGYVPFTGKKMYGLHVMLKRS